MFSAKLIKEIKALFAHYPKKENALLPILHLVQKERGKVDREAMKEVAKLCEVPLTHVEGVATFYTMYHQEEEGKTTFHVCTNVACWIKGGVEILDHLEEKLKIKAGEKTDDGQFMVKEVECLGACGYAPVMIENEEYHENLTKEKVDQLLKKHQKQ